MFTTAFTTATTYPYPEPNQLSPCLSYRTFPYFNSCQRIRSSPRHLSSSQYGKFFGKELLVKVKVKWSHYRPGVAQRVGRGIALLFHDSGIRRGWVVSSTPRPYFTPGKTRHPFYSRLSGLKGRSGRAENLVPTGIRSPTVQSVGSRYTNWATRPTRSY